MRSFATICMSIIFMIVLLMAIFGMYYGIIYLICNVLFGLGLSTKVLVGICLTLSVISGVLRGGKND